MALAGIVAVVVLDQIESSFLTKEKWTPEFGQLR